MFKSSRVLLSSILLMTIWAGVYPTPKISQENIEVQNVTNKLRYRKFDSNNIHLTIDIDVEKRNKVKEMMQHAWNNYVLYAWGENELRPLSKMGNRGGTFQDMPLGSTILESLDTLYIMGMKEDFLQARDWIANKLNLEKANYDVPVFDVTSRLIGGLLSSFTLTGDVLFRDKAQEFAKKLLPAFDTPTGVPNSLINFKTGIGGLHLEMTYLSDVIGNPIYKNNVKKIRQFLQATDKPNGLYSIYLNPKTGEWGRNYITWGPLGYTFYDYLLKSWLHTNKEDQEARQMFDDAMQAAFLNLIHTSSSGLLYFADSRFGRLERVMHHITCSLGGLLGLASMTVENDLSSKYIEVGEEITKTCHESYNRTYTKLGPESFRFTDTAEAKAVKSTEKFYLLRPEVVESYFIMYRITRDPKYRRWGWEVVQALENYCRTPSGYNGFKNVYVEDPQQDDIQQSFFLAQTLKYLYLLFSDDKLIPLDEWVFNSEGHPLHIKDVNPHYKKLS